MLISLCESDLLMKTIWRPDNFDRLEERPSSHCVLWEERTSQEQRRLWVNSTARKHKGEIVWCCGFYLWDSVW